MAAGVEHALLGGAAAVVALNSNARFLPPQIPAGHQGIGLGELAPQHGFQAREGEPQSFTLLELRPFGELDLIGQVGQSHGRTEVAGHRRTGLQQG